MSGTPRTNAVQPTSFPLVAKDSPVVVKPNAMQPVSVGGGTQEAKEKARERVVERRQSVSTKNPKLSALPIHPLELLPARWQEKAKAKKEEMDSQAKEVRRMMMKEKLLLFCPCC